MKILFLFLLISQFPSKAEDLPCSESVNFGPNVNSSSIAKVISELQTIGSRIHSSCPEWSYIPIDLLNNRLKKSCQLSRKRAIFIYGENHSDPEDYATSWYVNELVNSKGNAIKFDESSEWIDRERGFYGLNSIKTAQKYTSLLLYLAQADNPMFSEVINSHLAGSICGFSDRFISSEIPFSSEKAKAIVSEIKKIVLLPNDFCIDKLKSYLLQNNVENLKEVVAKFKDVVGNQLNATVFKGVPREKMDTRVIQELRELEWLEVVKDATCNEDKNQKDFWLKVGLNHSKSLSCAMEQLFSEEIKASLLSIRTISKNDVKFNEKLKQIQKNVVEVINSEIHTLSLPGQVKFVSQYSKGIILNLSEVQEKYRKEVISKVSPKINNLNIYIESKNYDGSALLYLNWKFKDLSFLISDLE